MRLPRRFDDALMHPPDARSAVDTTLLASLRSWCAGGAGSVLKEPLRVASIAPHAGLDAAACVLDGSYELARLGRWRGLRWRLRLLWQEQVMGRDPQPGDPWDCGWWRDGPLAPAIAFQPRRATLLMLREPNPAAAAALLGTFRDSSPGYARPLRVLVVSAAAVPGIARL
jgi:hypothetical protein